MLPNSNYHLSLFTTAAGRGDYRCWSVRRCVSVSDSELAELVQQRDISKAVFPPVPPSGTLASPLVQVPRSQPWRSPCELLHEAYCLAVHSNLCKVLPPTSDQTGAPRGKGSMSTGEPPQLGQGSEGRARAACRQGAVAQGHGPGRGSGPACGKACSGRQCGAGWRSVCPASRACMRRCRSLMYCMFGEVGDYYRCRMGGLAELRSLPAARHSTLIAVTAGGTASGPYSQCSCAPFCFTACPSGKMSSESNPLQHGRCSRKQPLSRHAATLVGPPAHAANPAHNVHATPEGGNETWDSQISTGQKKE